MIITLITEENLAFFKPLAPDALNGFSSKILGLGVLDEERNIAGLAVSQVSAPMLDIQHFFILPPYRGQGYGRFLMDKLLETAKELKLQDVRASFPASASFSGFFSGQGFSLFPGEEQYTVSLKALHSSWRFRRYIQGGKVSHVKMMDSLSASQTRILRQFFSAEGIPWEGSFEKEYSSVDFFRKRVASLMLCARTADGVSVNYLYSRNPKPLRLLQHFRALDIGLEKSRKENGDYGALSEEEFKVRFLMLNEKSLRLAAAFTNGEELEKSSQFVYAVKTVF